MPARVGKVVRGIQPGSSAPGIELPDAMGSLLLAGVLWGQAGEVAKPVRRVPIVHPSARVLPLPGHDPCSGLDDGMGVCSNDDEMQDNNTKNQVREEPENLT